MFMSPGTQIMGLAQEVGLAREQLNLAIQTIRENPVLSAELEHVRAVNGDESFTLANGSRYLIKAASVKSGRGLSIDEVNFDELRTQRNTDAWASVSYTTMARPNSQIWCMSNAGDDESVVLNQLREAALTGREPTVGIFEWSAEYDDDDYCQIDDWHQISQANPALGHIIAARAIASAMATDPPAVFRTEALCQRVRNLLGAIDMKAFADCADPAVTMDNLKNRLAVVFAVAPDGAHATLAVAARTNDGKPRGEIIKAWPDTNDARRELPHLLHQVKPSVIGWFPSSPGAELAPIFRAPGTEPTPIEKARPGRPNYTDITGVKVNEVCMGLAGLIKGRQVLHNDDPLLRAHCAAASKQKSGDGWHFAWQNETETSDGKVRHVDAAYAFAGAVHLALLLPEPRRAKVRLLTA